MERALAPVEARAMTVTRPNTAPDRRERKAMMCPPFHSNPAETNPAETNPAETNPAETNPAETKLAHYTDCAPEDFFPVVADGDELTRVHRMRCWAVARCGSSCPSTISSPTTCRAEPARRHCSNTPSIACRTCSSALSIT
jgi:hypothetical protein